MTLSVKSLLGQKHLASLLEVHVGTRVSQVLMHWGTTLGQEEVGTGLETGEVSVEPEPDEAVAVALAVHLVQTVRVEVTVIVDSVLVVITVDEEPELIVLVMGQVVTVS